MKNLLKKIAINATICIVTVVVLFYGHLTHVIFFKLGSFPFREWIQLYGLNLPWIIVLALPVGVLVGTSLTYSTLSQNFKNGLSELTHGSFLQYCKPALVLGVLVAILEFAIHIFVVYEQNHKLAEFMTYLKKGEKIERTYRGDRELSIAGLYKKVKEYKELSKNERDPELANKHKRKSFRHMVEMVKQISTPILTFLFSLLGVQFGILSTAFSKGRKSILFILIFLILLITWNLLIAGEYLGDRGILHPIAAMSQTVFTVIIIELSIMKPVLHIFNTKILSKQTTIEK